MTGIHLEDGTSIEFMQEKYKIYFEGMTVMFLIKKEYEHPRRESKIVLDYANKTAYFEWADGHNETQKFLGLI